MSAAPWEGRLSLRRYGAQAAGHAHDHVQVLWACRGVLSLRIGRSALDLAPGTACVIPAQAWHGYAAARGSACLVLDTHAAIASRLQARLLDARPLGGLLRWLEQAAGAARAEALLQSARPLLQTCLDDAGQSSMTPSRVRRAIDWMALQDWVDARLEVPLRVADLAARVHLSPTQFTVRCIEEQGSPPAAWLRERRVRKARFLRRQGWSAERAALACGYAGASALIAATHRVE